MSEEKPTPAAEGTGAKKPLTDFIDLLPDLFAGVFLGQIEAALSDAALGAVTWGDKGKKATVSISFDLTRIGETNQVAVKHSISYNYPTKRGKKSETSTTETPMHVGPRGRLTLLPTADQGGLFNT